ncbi:hypothetical protein ACJ7K1_04980 [Paenibacillus elgii]
MLKRKFVSSCLAFALLLLPTSSFAASSQSVEPSSSKEAVSEYLKAVQAQDLDKVVHLVVDKRFSNDEEEKKGYKEMLKYKRDQFKKLEILEESSVSADEVKYVVFASAKDGSEENMPITTKKVDGKWRVVITPDDQTKDSKYKRVKEATEKEEVKADIQLSPEIFQAVPKDKDKIPQAQNLMSSALMNYSWWNRLEGTTFYSDATFDFQKNQLLLNYRQWCDSNLGRDITTNVTYTVVKQGFFNDTEWGSVQEPGDNQNNAKQKYLSGSSDGLKGAKLRFKIPVYSNQPNNPGYVSFAGHGELY